MKKIVLLAALSMLAACSQKAEEKKETPAEPAAEAAPAPVADSGTAPGTYDVKMADGTMGTTTINADGSPHQIVIWYTLRGDEIVVNSRRGRRWPSNLLRDDRANLAVYQGEDAVTIACVVERTYEGEEAQADIAEMFRASLLAKRPKELERGLTLTGPHRDDLILRVRDLPVKGYASHGESWSVALALRLASAELLRAESPAGDPVLILDDVFAELDADRRQRLAALTAGYEQVVVTAAVEEDIPEVLHAHVVRISAGTISDERAAADE